MARSVQPCMHCPRATRMHPHLPPAAAAPGPSQHQPAGWRGCSGHGTAPGQAHPGASAGPPHSPYGMPGTGEVVRGGTRRELYPLGLHGSPLRIGEPHPSQQPRTIQPPLTLRISHCLGFSLLAPCPVDGFTWPPELCCPPFPSLLAISEGTISPPGQGVPCTGLLDVSAEQGPHCPRGGPEHSKKLPA